MNQKLSLLIGLLLSDGSVYYDKSKQTYCIQFTNKNIDLIAIFKNLMKDCFDVKKFYNIKCKNAISVRVFSKKIAEILFSYTPTFRTLPCDSKPKCNMKCCVKCNRLFFNKICYPPAQIHEDILNDSLFISAFLKGFASADGSFYVNKKHGIYVIEITCYHPTLRNQINLALNSLSIKTRATDRAVFVSGYDNCRKFLDIIGFLVPKTGSFKFSFS